MKYAFFDLDGVLSVPRYNMDGRIVCGGPSDWWEKYNSLHTDAYRLCRSPRFIKKYVANLNKNGVKCYVLTVARKNCTKQNKETFIAENYKNMFEKILFVEENAQKVEVMIAFAEEHGVPRDEIYFVDDTFQNDIDAAVAGINAHHVSEFID